MNISIVIPARYGSKRFPGKPLTDLAGKTLLQRAIDTAKKSINILLEKKHVNLNIELLVATDDLLIIEHAKEQNVTAILTSVDCKTGTDRVLQAVNTLSYKPDLIVNLQGDNPYLPTEYIVKLILNLQKCGAPIATPAMQLTWQELDNLRESKKKTPFSGTTVIINKTDNSAIWFSKNIIPAIRNENNLKKIITENTEQNNLSPVFKHIGLYGYTYDGLQTFAKLQETELEKLEGLEQLRAIENNLRITIVEVTEKSKFIMGIDSQEDKQRFLDLLNLFGEPGELEKNA